MGLFGKSKPADPKALVDEWTKKIRKEGYGLDRQIRQIQRSEQAAIKSIKEATKKGDHASAKILAKEVVHSRKAVSKIYTAKANLKSVEMQMKGQAAQVRVAGSLSKSADVMKSMQQLVKVPEIQKTMQELSKEMMKVRNLNNRSILSEKLKMHVIFALQNKDADSHEFFMNHVLILILCQFVNKISFLEMIKLLLYFFTTH